MREMKTKIIVCMLMLLSSVLCFAEEETAERSVYWLNSYPENQDLTFHHTILIANSRSSDKGIVVNNLSTQLFYRMNCPYGRVAAGFQQTENSDSFTVNGTYWFLNVYRRTPEVKIKSRLGANLIYNFQYLNNVSVQNNLFMGLNHQIIFKKYVSFNTSLLYGLKFSTIFSLQDVVPFLYNNDLGFSFACSINFPYQIIATLRFSTYEDFYYPFFCAPTFSLGVSYALKNQFAITGEIAARYVDMFTLSSYLDCYWFRLMVGYTFK